MSQDVACTVCGADNNSEVERCSSCGARLELFEGSLTEEEAWARRHQQEGFEWKWVGISCAIFMVMQALALVALPIALPNYDPQGLPGIVITAGIWFIGSALIGMISPGRTFLEPTVGAILVIAPTMFWLERMDEIYQLSSGTYIAAGLLSIMIALFGAFFGEMIQNKKASA